MGSYLLASYSCYSQEYSGSSKADLLFMGGYTAFNIQNNQYTGYDASLKLLFPYKNSTFFSLGIGAKYESVSYIPPSVAYSQAVYSHMYESLQTGIDVAFKLSYPYVTFLLNPYLYYSLYDAWMQETTSPFQQSYSPYINDNFNYGIGLSALFKYEGEQSDATISGYYFGPSFYYSRGYIVYNPAEDTKGNSYKGGEGGYDFYSINFVVGMFF